MRIFWNLERSFVLFPLLVIASFISLRKSQETMIAQNAMPLAVIGTFLALYFTGSNIDTLMFLVCNFVWHGWFCLYGEDFAQC